MNGKPHNLLSFVGAMKIARNVAVSERHVEWYAPIPGSLSEGAGVGLAPSIRVLAKIPGYGRFSSPLRNSKDLTSYHSIGYSLKSGVAGDFHRPYGSSVFYISPFGAPTKKAAGYSAAFWEVITLQRLLRAGWGQGWRWHACKSSAAAPPSPEPPQSCQTR